MDDSLVAGLPSSHAGADLPDDARAVGAADVAVVLGVHAEHRDRPAEGGPDIVVVDPSRHYPNHDFEGAGLRHFHFLEAHRMGRLAKAVFSDHPCLHRVRQLADRRLDLARLRDQLRRHRHTLRSSGTTGSGAVPVCLNPAEVLDGHRDDVGQRLVGQARHRVPRPGVDEPPYAAAVKVEQDLSKAHRAGQAQGGSRRGSVNGRAVAPE